MPPETSEQRIDSGWPALLKWLGLGALVPPTLWLWKWWPHALPLALLLALGAARLLNLHTKWLDPWLKPKIEDLREQCDLRKALLSPWSRDRLMVIVGVRDSRLKSALQLAEDVMSRLLGRDLISPRTLDIALAVAIFIPIALLLANWAATGEAIQGVGTHLPAQWPALLRWGAVLALAVVAVAQYQAIRHTKGVWTTWLAFAVPLAVAAVADHFWLSGAHEMPPLARLLTFIFTVNFIWWVKPTVGLGLATFASALIGPSYVVLSFWARRWAKSLDIPEQFGDLFGGGLTYAALVMVVLLLMRNARAEQPDRPIGKTWVKAGWTVAYMASLVGVVAVVSLGATFSAYVNGGSMEFPRYVRAEGGTWFEILYLLAMPLMNAVLFTLSIGITRIFLRRYLHQPSGWMMMLAADLLAAAALSVASLAGILVVLQLLAATGWTVDPDRLARLVAEGSENAQSRWALSLALVNFVPSLLHIALASAALVSGWMYASTQFARDLASQLTTPSPLVLPGGNRPDSRPGFVLTEPLSRGQAAKLAHWMFVDWWLLCALLPAALLAAWPLLQAGLRATAAWFIG